MRDFSNRLEPADRLVLMLRWADGCTEREIASIIGEDVHAVRASIARIRMLARGSLAAAAGASKTAPIPASDAVLLAASASVSSTSDPAARRDRSRPLARPL